MLFKIRGTFQHNRVIYGWNDEHGKYMSLGGKNEEKRGERERIRQRGKEPPTPQKKHFYGHATPNRDRLYVVGMDRI